VLEGLCKRYISKHKKEKKTPTKISPDTFEDIKEQYIDLLERHDDIIYSGAGLVVLFVLNG
jgi:hypothetical protein